MASGIASSTGRDTDRVLIKYGFVRVPPATRNGIIFQDKFDSVFYCDVSYYDFAAVSFAACSPTSFGNGRTETQPVVVLGNINSKKAISLDIFSLSNMASVLDFAPLDRLIRRMVRKIFANAVNQSNNVSNIVNSRFLIFSYTAKYLAKTPKHKHWSLSLQNLTIYNSLVGEIYVSAGIEAIASVLAVSWGE
jgi:hypothetical protein